MSDDTKVYARVNGKLAFWQVGTPDPEVARVTVQHHMGWGQGYPFPPVLAVVQGGKS